MKKVVLFLFVILISVTVSAQVDSSAADADIARKGVSDTVAISIQTLTAVEIKAYEQFKNRLDVPAAIGIIRGRDLNRFSQSNILPAVNNIPGVRMEERSPGSYRFGIRGSAANAPFGVRNIKVYYNDIPYTDPGGNTYLNQPGYYNIRSLEIIKEPGSSLYGAGTGGVLLINSFPEAWQRGASFHYTTGSYSLQNIVGEVRLGDSNFQNTVTYQHLSADGYREQSALRKNTGAWDAVYKHGKGTMRTHFLYSDLSYQTPGGLTKVQYDANPQAARPPAGTIPGAAQNKATIYQNMFLAGFTYDYPFSRHWRHVTTLYGTYTQLVNPTIRNYSRVLQPHFGGRTVVKFNTKVNTVSLETLGGAEVQQGYSSENTFDNNTGSPGNLQQHIEVNNNLVTGFAQASAQWRKWTITGGASINRLAVSIHTFYPTPYSELNKEFNNQVAPRLALLYKATCNVSVYASSAKGYSPPTTEQIVPSGNHPDISLQAAEGWNYQVGGRGYLIRQKLYYDVDVFYMKLANALVQRRDSAGGDYYLNAGGTQQAGMEAAVSYKLIQAPASALNYLSIGAAYTYSVFTYENFVQLTTDLSGKRLPGVAPHTISGILDLHTGYHVYLNVNCYYSAGMPLDDANTAYADAYTLLDARLGYRMIQKRFGLDIFCGANNLLDERYSLGNDINAAGGRYYNAAAPRNYFAGISISGNY